ncbi:MAG: alpha-amylase family glycosyl hydrolase [Capsulimonadaceae bacterium]|nr:alpha-amylase family glycosyl hydrolase [Capsulimonadaceae bacterium]
MIKSIHDPSISKLFKSLRTPSSKTVKLNGSSVTIQTPFPSPADWRDVWMYQLVIDRFDNPAAEPRAQWDGRNRYLFQGGTLEGVRKRLPYLQELGVRAIWLSPVQKNCLYRPTYHGYAVQNFLAIDPRLSSDPEAARKDPSIVENELHLLIDEAHARGMYVVFDIVLHHTGDVFAYPRPDGTTTNKIPFQHDAAPVVWRDSNGQPNPDWQDASDIPYGDDDAGVWPVELRSNHQFYRRGEGFEIETDFMSLKALVTDGSTDTRETLIRAYEYIVGKFDVDGLRVDAFKHIDRTFGRTFCTSMREFAETIGKRNFFIFCEVFDSEDMIAQYIGRNTVTDNDELKAADAALDFPLMFVLPDIAKGIHPPSNLAAMYDHRRELERHILSTHGEASKFFVTFLDNHDSHHRVYYSPADNPNAYDDQLEIAIGCLFGLQGIPCVYYGTEQGLHGWGNDEEAVREALWGKPGGGFDQNHRFYQFLKRVAAVRAEQPPLRYGRQYFRPVSIDTESFYVPTTPGDPIAFSRVLAEQEVLVVANPNLHYQWTGYVIVDIILNAHNEAFDVLLSNKPGAASTVHAETYPDGKSRYIPITLRPGEIQIISNRN